MVFEFLRKVLDPDPKSRAEKKHKKINAHLKPSKGLSAQEKKHAKAYAKAAHARVQKHRENLRAKNSV